ncbi:MAG: PQQ-binding-like beta-propeller repeat protein [Bacteroidia bacterium]|nr:PQQ-binding-like beta-propeller repeat protein [Bacteroidia bacterium]
MNKRTRYTILTAAIVLLAASFTWWLASDPVRDFIKSLPGSDNRPPRADSLTELVHIGEYFFAAGGTLTEGTETWPRFRGSDFDNISKSKIKLIDGFGGIVPKILWSLDLGEGHAGAAIYKGAVYVLDYDELKRSDILRCINLADGKEVWQRGYRVTIKRNHGMSRTVPAVTEKYIVSIGPRAHVMCLDRLTGNVKWGLDVEREYKTEIPFWYTGQCPLIDNDVAIIATGGRALMIAVDCETGKKVWEAPNTKNWKMSHSSIMPMKFGGRKMFVYSAVGGICGIAADGQDAGTILWTSTAWNKSVVAPSPVCMPDGKIFLTAGYGAGSMVLQLEKSGGKFTAKMIDQYLPPEGLACEQQTPLYFEGHLIGIQPKDARALQKQMICVDPANCRVPVWASGPEIRFGLGPYLIADNKLFILNDDGVLTIAKPDIKKYIQVDQIKLFDGQDAWAPIAVAGGYMVLRDSKRMVAIKLAVE